MVRIADARDAKQLARLNEEFNGKGNADIGHIASSLSENRQEIVIVDEEGGVLTGFVCVQLKKSICYRDRLPEITEVYVSPAYRKRGIAGRMISFTENFCQSRYPLHQFELLTGSRNVAAQSVYKRLGYLPDGEIHLSKEINPPYKNSDTAQ